MVLARLAMEEHESGPWNILVGFSGIFVGHTSGGPWVTELTNIAQFLLLGQQLNSEVSDYIFFLHEMLAFLVFLMLRFF